MGLITGILMCWVLVRLNAPLWCYVLVLISMSLRFLDWYLED